MTRAPLLLEGPKPRTWGWIWGWVGPAVAIGALWWYGQLPPSVPAVKAKPPPTSKEEEATRRLEAIAETQVRESLGTLVKHRDLISPTEEITTLELPPSARGNLFEPGFSNCIIYRNLEYRTVRFICAGRGTE